MSLDNPIDDVINDYMLLVLLSMLTSCTRQIDVNIVMQLIYLSRWVLVIFPACYCCGDDKHFRYAFSAEVSTLRSDM